MVEISEFEMMVRDACKQFTERTGLECRYISSGDVGGIAFENTPPSMLESPIRGDVVWVCGIVVEDRLVMGERMRVSQYSDENVKELCERALSRNIEENAVEGLNKLLGKCLEENLP